LPKRIAETFEPPHHVVLLHIRHEVFPTPDAFVQRHCQHPACRIGDFFGAVGIDLQGIFHLFGRAREAVSPIRSGWRDRRPPAHRADIPG